MFAGLAAVLAILWLHYPFAGYETTCTERATRFSMSIEPGAMGEGLLRFNPYRACAEQDDLPITQWQSLGALTPYLSSVAQLLVWEFFVWLVAAAALVLFGLRRKSSS